MTVAQQIILNMVMDNTTIPVFERAGICTFAYFETDYRFLEFVRTRYLEKGSVNLGELVSHFADFPPADLDSMSTDTDFLIYHIKESYIYNSIANAIESGQDKFKDDGIQFLGYLEDIISGLREVVPNTQDYDIIAHVKDRQEQYIATCNDPKAFIPTGFPEIDKLIGGWSKNGELVSFLARMGMGKTWILIYCCISAWRAGFKCGFISIEMSESDIGLRMDTVLSGLSNSALRRGNPVDMTIYNKYIADMENKSGIFVRRKKDFKGHITPSKIAQWIRTAGLDIVFIDGIGYIESERINARNKSDAALITDVSEDLMSVSTDEHCPIILTSQANRGGSDRSMNPGLEAARGSDGVNINATFVASIAYPDESHETMCLEVLKSRFGTTGSKFNYDWNPDIGYIKSQGAANVQQGQAFYG